MIEDRELETWRQQWNSGAAPLPESQTQLQTKIHKRIKRQNLRFVIGNLVAAIAGVGALIFAAWAVRQEPSRLRIGWAIGLSVMVCVCAGYRVWLQRGTWRPQTQSTGAFVELWHRRVVARLRMISAGFYMITAWLVFCGILAAANWSLIGPDVYAHPRDWLVVLGAVVLIVLAAFLKLAWYRRRKRAELEEVSRFLQELEE
jgi:hypothetical protein